MRVVAAVVVGFAGGVWCYVIHLGRATDRDARHRAKRRAEQRALDRLFAPPPMKGRPR